MPVKSSPEDQHLKLVFTPAVADAQPTVGVYSPFVGCPQIDVPAGYRVINFHQLLSDNSTRRRRRSYEVLVNRDIDIILRAKDTFFSLSNVNIIIARTFIDLQMVSGAMRSMVERPQQQSLFITHRSLDQFLTPDVWSIAATPAEREVLDKLYRRSGITVHVFNGDKDINHLYIDIVES
jgi:hypothetical protein